MSVYFHFHLAFYVEFIQVFKYVVHIRKFSNPTIIFKVFVQMLVGSDLMTYFMPGARRVLLELCPVKSNARTYEIAVIDVLIPFRRIAPKKW